MGSACVPWGAVPGVSTPARAADRLQVLRSNSVHSVEVAATLKGQALKGKTIRKVHQVHWDPGEHRPRTWIIDAIEFTDGSVLRFVTVEGDSDYGVEGIYPALKVSEDS